MPLGLRAPREEEAVEVLDGLDVGRGGRQGERGELGTAEHAVAGGPMGLGRHGRDSGGLDSWNRRGIR